MSSVDLGWAHQCIQSVGEWTRIGWSGKLQLGQFIFFTLSHFLQSTRLGMFSAAAAAAAKSLQSCPTLCDPTDSSPPGSPIPGTLQARILEWVAISFSNACMHAKSLSHVQLWATLWTAAHQPPLSMGFSRQEYWSGLPFPSPNSFNQFSWRGALLKRVFHISTWLHAVL